MTLNVKIYGIVGPDKGPLKWVTNYNFPEQDNYQYVGPHQIHPLPPNGIVELNDRGRPQMVPGSGGCWFGSSSNIQCPDCKCDYLHYPRNKDLTYHCCGCDHLFDIYGQPKSYGRAT